MSDKMLRISARGQDGLAKAINASSTGSLLTEPAIETFMNETSSVSGREIAVGGTWESNVLRVNGLNIIHFHTSLSKSLPYRIEVEEVVTGHTVKSIQTQKFGEPSYLSNISEWTKISSPTFKIRIINLATEPLRIGLYLYATSETALVLKNKHLMNETSSASGRELLPGETWESPIYKTDGLNKLAYRTHLSSSVLYSVEVVEFVDSRSTFEVYRKNLGAQIESQNISGVVGVGSPLFKIVIKNLDSKPFRIGVSMSLLHGDVPSDVHSKTFMKSAAKVSLPPKGEWISPRLITHGYNQIAFFTSLTNEVSKQGDFDLIIAPATLANGNPRREFEEIILSSGLPSRNQSGIKLFVAEFIFLIIKNKSNNTIEVGVDLYATH